MSRAVTQTAEKLTESQAAPRSRGLTLPQLWVIAAIALPVIASLEASLSAIDLSYQIRAGDIMLRTHSLIRVDTFTFTAAGRPWLDQQWGAQIVLALVHRLGGYSSLALLRALMVAGIYFFVYRACRAAGAGLRQASWLTVGSFLATYGGLAMRPQLFGMALFALTVWLVADRARHPMRLWMIPGLVVLWANLHGSFFLAPLLLGLAWLQDRRDDPRGARRLLLLAFVSLAAATLNPFGLHVWTYVVSLSTNPTVHRFVGEWGPPTIRRPYGVAFFTSAIAVAAFLARRRAPADRTVLLQLGIFFLLGLGAQRAIIWWALAAPAIVAVLLPSPPGRSARDRGSFINAAIATAMLALIVLSMPWLRGRTPLSPSGRVLSNAPAGLTNELRRVSLPGQRIFDAETWGSWFEFALPDRPMFADSRFDVIPPSAWEDYSKVSFGLEGWEQILDRWHVDVVVASPTEQAPLIPRIRGNAGWRLVYQDEEGSIFVRV